MQKKINRITQLFPEILHLEEILQFDSTRIFQELNMKKNFATYGV